jgi:hypothetical protein
VRQLSLLYHAHFRAALAAQDVHTDIMVVATQQQVWRAVTLLQGVEAHWEETAPAAASRARRLWAEIKSDSARSRLAAEQGGAEERHGFAKKTENRRNYSLIDPTRSVRRLVPPINLSGLATVAGHRTWRLP